jgi:hypothetical protein
VTSLGTLVLERIRAERGGRVSTTSTSWSNRSGLDQFDHHESPWYISVMILP